MEDRCYEQMCSGHGSCDTNSGECRCAPGYMGADCAEALQFPGSRLITAELEDNLDGWMKAKVKGKQWSLCFSSFTDDATTPSTFHRLCDQHDTTLTVARNSLNYTFGGYVRLPPPASFRSCSPFVSSEERTGQDRTGQDRTGQDRKVGRGRS